MPQKITWFFNQRKNGWTESWYMNEANIQAALVVATPALVARRQLLGANTTIEHMRAVDVDVFNFDGLPGEGDKGKQNRGGTDASDNPWNCILCSRDALDKAKSIGYHAALTLRGVPDDWIKNDVLTNRPVPWDSKLLDAFAAFKKAICGEPVPAAAGSAEPNKSPYIFYLRAIDRGVAKKLITELAPGPKKVLDVATTTIVTCPGHGYGAGEQVRIKGVRGTNVRQINGIWVVFPPITGDTFQVKATYTDDDATKYNGGATAQGRATNLFPIVDIKLKRYSDRDTGRAFFVTRGRRRGFR